MSGGTRRLAQVGLVVVSLLLVLLVAEVALRITSGPHPKDGLWYRDLSVPNQDSHFLGIPFRTNSRGLRGPDYAPQPAPGVFRILFGGDSYTMGWRVTEAQTYTNLAIAELNARSERDGSGLRFEAVNAALAGLNVTQVVDRVEENAAAYSPDLIVYGYTINDIRGPADRSKHVDEAALKLMQRHGRYGDSPSYLVRFVWPRWTALQERWNPTLAPYDRMLHDSYFDNPEAWRAVEDGFDRMAELARSRGICAHLLVHTQLSQLGRDEHPFGDIYERLEEAAGARGMTVTQTYPYFADRDADEMVAAYLDSHPGVESHELLKDALLEGLGTLPPECLIPRRGRATASGAIPGAGD